jgi:hypothetical protein
MKCDCGAALVDNLHADWCQSRVKTTMVVWCECGSADDYEFIQDARAHVCPNCRRVGLRMIDSPYQEGDRYEAL